MSTSRHNFAATLADRYGRRLRRFLSARMRNSPDVADLAQEVFLRLLRVEHHQGIRSPEAYLFTIASHVLHQHAVRKAAEPVTVDIEDLFGEFQALAGEDPAAAIDEHQRMQRLDRVLAELPPRVGASLVMHKIGGYTVQEIADQLGVARETVKGYLARAAEHCRKHRASIE